MFYISTQRPILCSHSSDTHSTLLCSLLTTQKTIAHSSLQWNALPYMGKFDGQTAFGIYGLAATCGHNNTNKTLQPVALNINTAHTPYNAATAALRLQPIYGYGQSTVTVDLRLQPIYGYGQSTVTVNLQLRPVYGCGQSTVAVTLFCYYGLSAHYSYSSAIFRPYALSECNFSSIVYLQ